MPKFQIQVREVHVSTMELEADSKEHAIHLVGEGEGEEVSLEYSNTLGPETWTAEEVE